MAHLISRSTLADLRPIRGCRIIGSCASTMLGQSIEVSEDTVSATFHGRPEACTGICQYGVGDEDGVGDGGDRGGEIGGPDISAGDAQEPDAPADQCGSTSMWNAWSSRLWIDTASSEALLA